MVLLQATAELADLAASLPSLTAFVYVSTAYVNGFLPPMTRVEERFYPVFCQGEKICHDAFVRHVQSLSASEVHVCDLFEGESRKQVSMLSDATSSQFCERTANHCLWAQAEAFVGQLAFPNSYCVTKWLAEQLMAERHSLSFPVVILRPAIIGAAAGAPYPG